MAAFVHLHTHSYYSLLNGVPSPEELVIAAKRAGMSALALTDRNGLYGAVEFYQKAREARINPIIGAELTLDDGFNIVLLVQNDTGYRHLSHLISEGRLRGGHGGFRLSAKQVHKYNAGLTALSAGNTGKVNDLLAQRNITQALAEVRRWRNAFGERYYLELNHIDASDTLVNLRLRDIAVEQGVPLAATNDVYFIDSKDWHLRRVLQAIDQNTAVENVENAGRSEQYFKDADAMNRLFKSFPQAVSNTLKISRSCPFDFQLGKPVFPSIDLPEKETGFSWLWKKCFQGASRRYQPLTGAVIKRLEFELQTIHNLGFAEYFLIVKDIVDYCHRQHIPCVGRGSAADSLVAYVLEITQVDPLRHNLYFERFLNPERRDPPDIDLDICWKNRDHVLDYVYQKYGKERTAMICTFNTFQNRSAIRDIAKAYGLPEDEIGKITKHLPHRAAHEVEEAINTLPELKELRHNLTVYQEILKLARRIADFPRHLSIHPGGVIIAPDNITYHTPLEIAGKGIIISQYDMYTIEKLGLVKMDLLGVRSLSIITDCLKLIRRHYGSSAETGSDRTEALKAALLLKQSAELSPLDLKTIPENDLQVTAFIRSGATMGCFQLESPGMRGLLKKMRIDDVDDVITAVALIRPGASGSGMKDIYIKRRAGLQKVQYVHSSLAQALDETYGVVIYQEQVLKVAHFVAGLSLSQADTLRRAMTKSRQKNEFMKVRRSFIEGAVQRRLQKEQAETVWNFLAQFVGYGFNKAHSATYGTIAYQTAYLKHYFPLEYMCAVLNNQGGFYSRMAYVEEARRMGIRLLPPDINASGQDFTCDKERNAIRAGLGPVFELTQKTIKAIIDERRSKPFDHLPDFIRRTRAGEKECSHLIKAGALQSIDASAPRLLLMSKLFFKNRKKALVTEYIGKDVVLESFNRYQNIINEMEMLDFAVTGHPLTLFEEQLRQYPHTSSRELETHNGRRITFCGWLVTSRRVATSNNQFMKFLTLEDKQGLCEAVLFPAVYIRYGHLIRSHGPYCVTGKVQSRLPGEANLIVERLEVIEMDKQEVEALLQQKQPAWES
ncbi:MAG: DNA polymerase III subunit alpha [Caldithrix sp.]|nr:DNA polymerase III subunit alpha [Caldithrix sp.]